MDEPLSDDLIAELLELAIEAARSPSELILSGFRSPQLAVEKKSDSSPVTEFDRNAERTIRTFLQAHAPRQWPVLGEEFGGDTAGSRYRWVIDPIDGTVGFTRGLPNFGTLLAFEDRVAGRALIGVIHLPAAGETYWARRGGGAWCGRERIHVAPDREFRDCLISAPPENQFRLAGTAASLDALRAQSPILRCFGDCAAHAMVARGSIDVLAEFNLARWDIAATEVVVEEAGGKVIVRDARDVRGKYDLIIGNPTNSATVARLLEF
ncbi:MAG TPA: inositol monophosphatase family protein [Steroidobacteraceae bacterium]|nr:inositol monophosphatase family protein [Steroidobacteraceae bacterium]